MNLVRTQRGQTQGRDLSGPSNTESFFESAIQGVAWSLLGASEPVAGDIVGSYRIVSLIGRGGMGSVYLAERADGEIQQQVAIKFLRAGGHRSEWRERFLRERQLLATLHHPSIVRVIDAGHTPDGLPYLVMEHVEGMPVDRYAAGIGIRDRLKLFLKVCEGVSHAHGHLIIHRDLKPSNILVDGAGQPKLLDFGIAKLLTAEADLTQAAEQMLTPNYASPEQLRGEVQTTATDVYSLGAVLYKLLTGVSPRENLRGRGKEEAAPPSRVNAEVPRDLDFVVRKALRPEAEQRYQSVEEFAWDVRAAMEWRPVEARGGDSWYRARRFLRRHWMPAAAAVLAMASLSVGMWMANRERQIAERRFAEVRQLANKLFDIDVQVAQLQGGSKTRQLIVDTALDYLTRVTADVHLDSGLSLELSTAYMRVARVQGVNISPNLGQTEQAARTEEKAQALIDRVLAAEPHNRTALLRAGQIAHDRMILAGDSHKNDEALRFARTAVERLDEYLRAGKLNASTERSEAQQVIIGLINVANRYRLADQFDESLRIAGRAIDVARATNWPTQAGAAMIIVALDHRSKGDLDKSLDAIRESVRALEPQHGESSVGRLHTYGLALMREGEILSDEGAISLDRPEEAEVPIRRALALGEELAQRDPNDFSSNYRVFSTETKLARIIHRTQPARALAMYDDGLRRLAGPAANGLKLRNEVETLAASVDPLLRLGRRREARKRLDDAFERLAILKVYPAATIELGSPADDTLRARAAYEADGGDFRRAAATYEEALRLTQAANPKPETSLQDAADLSTLYATAVPIERRAGRDDRADDLEARRLELWRHWDVRLPGNPFVKRQLAAAQEAGLTVQKRP